MDRRISSISKIIRKVDRSIARSSFVTSSLRVLVLRKAGVNIGDGTVINDGFTLACDIGYENNLVIEDRVAFGPNVTVVVTSHPNSSKLRGLAEKYPSFEVFGHVHVKHDAWIGAGVIILPNVTIGEYSIIGAGSVVTDNVSPRSVVAGVPAKVMRSIDMPEGMV